MSFKTIVLFIIIPLLIVLGGVGYKLIFQPVSPIDSIITDEDQLDTEQPPVVRDDVVIETLIQGEGDEVGSGDTVSVHYTGTFLDGRKFDSSLDRGEPFEFTIGESAVIQGWHMGVFGMKTGETRKIIIPAQFAYGEAGQGSIPPNTPLVFEIELLEIK